MQSEFTPRLSKKNEYIAAFGTAVCRSEIRTVFQCCTVKEQLISNLMNLYINHYATKKSK